MKDLTQSSPNEVITSKSLRYATGLIIFGVLSTGLASGVNKASVKDEAMWDTQLNRMIAQANWQEERGNISAAIALRNRIDDCISYKERCPKPNEFESVTELTLQSEDGRQEEYIALQ